ncbi:MAG TPA: GntR family transcriptional regulator [Gaiellaceae bacterium]|nr:GntR family transcriptional regulator [Gaiellaceae bacterium]
MQLADQAYIAIRNAIVSLELAPGAVIDERALIERLGIGRTPVREALRRLAHEQLVEVFPRRGMFVTNVDVRDLARISEVREALEPEAARLAAERANEDERDALAELGSSIVRGADLMDIDERIHRAIYAAAHNDLLEKTLGEYYVLAHRIWMIALDRNEALEEAVEAHRNLVLAIINGSGDRAADLMRAHVQDFEQAMRRVLVTV